MKKVRFTAERVKTTYLLPKKSFLIGMGSIFNLRGKYYDYSTSESGIKADRKALENDWKMIGQDMRDAQKQFENSH